MKFKNIYKITALIAFALVLQSKKNGPGGVLGLQVTGAPGSAGNPGTCANSSCHEGTAFNPSLTIQLLDGTTPVDQYTPFKTYTLKITNTPGNGNPARYGFQAVALNDSNKQAGDWGTLPANTQPALLNSRKYVEHSSPLSSGTFEIPWEAPGVGGGTVTFYSASVASNFNNSNAGDGVAAKSLIITEGASLTTGNTNQPVARMAVLRNPVGEMLHLEIISRRAGEHKIRIFSTAGKVVDMQPVNLQIGINRPSFNVSGLAPGLYVVQLCGEGHLVAAQMLKQ